MSALEPELDSPEERQESEEAGIDEGALRREYFRIVIPDIIKNGLVKGKVLITIS